MTQKIAAWKVDGGNAEQLPDAKIDEELDVEKWIVSSPEIAHPDMLIVGVRLTTDFGSEADILGITATGDLVLLELKKGRTPRDMIGQALEYASWVSSLGYEEIVELATRKQFSSESAFRQAFKQKFDSELPESINQAHEILLVAPEATPAIATVVEYLRESYGVPINLITFTVADVGGCRVLMRQRLLPEDGAKGSAGSKRQGKPSIERLLSLAAENAVAELAGYLWRIRPSYSAKEFIAKGWSYYVPVVDEVGKRANRVLYSVAVTKDACPSAVVLSFSPQTLAVKTSRDIEQCTALLRALGSEAGQEMSMTWGLLRFAVSDLSKVKHLVARVHESAGMSPPIDPDAETSTT